MSHLRVRKLSYPIFYGPTIRWGGVQNQKSRGDSRSRGEIPCCLSTSRGSSFARLAGFLLRNEYRLRFLLHPPVGTLVPRCPQFWDGIPGGLLGCCDDGVWDLSHDCADLTRACVYIRGRWAFTRFGFVQTVYPSFPTRHREWLICSVVHDVADGGNIHDSAKIPTDPWGRSYREAWVVP
jgi:hypothetical protein